MVLEAVMVVVDNSESSRNGDYQPTRFDSQVDAVNVLFQSITQGNPESSVGLMSMGGKGPEVLVTLTTEQGKILEGLHRTKKRIGGSSHLKTGIQVATLALKHRQNRSQRQRIIVFVCSPIEEADKELKILAKKMKKGNISVDFILFGDLDDDATKTKLEKFNEEVKSSEGSHFVVIPPSSKLLSDQLVSSPILLGENAGGGGGGMGSGGGGNDEFEFGFDPALEPELALALRMSMEEEKARQEKRAREEEQAATKASLEGIPEEGQGSGSKKDKKDGGDKMDTS
ncbi:26S proteasome regulatory subunit S5A, multiubiquitin chain binding protein [Cordyceps militaris CM01]|uniref:26S proteasome regulatory subunit S5A, multiubiquitin chain binding protein n=2 Tax=Cordyceps militaris TaxID=73501 RepID=G3JL86_CORMM|nr:26S proteasome regulatory subunit S5A, multiubiquitin chain binding protein [Cordyceps militaris CM01]ATY63442.1 26S proteasome regulatory subunit multiubiquitin chain binding [Cordyceps militaris]EGX90460.1 26S proteasome regulatory subunit S5A, multiubiquitin chain binding protein [Cordyceps militaris CM01]